ncbi:GNAT family N-acetyltransferase [Fulvivirgaceae bacterium BMA10]|uniref:GNAT family N-acetyltransferase n=1 Tax=Splendidivirga corallicola TaxID=3051826 RepID=A0ABT8KNY3_9BACT|nr:GNAT family N-acetyltransferase [Fulvivirgaceae bacterium BMA10]
MTIRLYKETDKRQLIELLRLNTPAYFDPSEEQEFIEYLDNESKNYFVVEEGNKILGCGGFNLLEGKEVVRISWDIFHPDSQGKGLGSSLIEFRIEQITRIPEVKIIAVRTSQLAFKFYEKFGFKLKETIKDFWAKGFDLYNMELSLERQ